MRATTSTYILFLLSLILHPTRQQRNEQDVGKTFSARTALKDQQHLMENLEMGSPDTTNAVSIFEDHNKPLLKMHHLDTSDLYRHLNSSHYSGKVFNLSAQNSSSSGNEDEYFCASGQSSLIYLLTMILYSVVCIVGLFGNTLVIYVVLRFSKMQTVTNIYILNLAIADECFLIGIPFLLYTMHTGRWSFGEYACKSYMVSTSITQFTSSIFLLIMSADRYIAVCHPISSPRYRTPMVSKMVSGIAWLTSVLLMLPVILFANAVSIDEHTTCNIEWPESENTQSGTTFILYSLVLGFATPLTFILGFYYLVIRKLHTVGRKHKSKEKKRSHRKVTRLVLTVITVYILCWLPYWISQVALITSSDHCMSRLEITIFLIVSCFAYSNSAMNPILYAFLSDNFKKSFLKACTCSAQKDFNAQLQLENSIFPRFSKSRASEKMVRSNTSKGKQQRGNVSNTGLSRMTSSTTAATTTTCTNATSMEANHSVAAPEKIQTNQENHQLTTVPIIAVPLKSSPCGSALSNNHLVVPLNGSMTTVNSMMDNSSDCSGIVGMPLVQQTDL